MARKRIVDVTANTTLSKNQSGATVVLAKADGLTLKLPNKGRGLEYEVVVKTALTSNTYKVIGNDSASMRGTIMVAADGGVVATSQGVYAGNGTTHIAVIMNSTARGGLVGTEIKFICDNDGVWNVVGKTIGSGTLATPFSTS